MSLLKFIMFSSLEYFSSLIFILVQFRFSLRENIEKIALISILLSFVSYSLIEADMRAISPLVQNAIFLIYIWMVLRVSLPNSIIMLLTGYTVFGLVQTCIIAIYAHLGLFQGEIVVGASISNQMQAVSSLVMIALSLTIFYLNGGFSFIGTRGKVNKKPATRKYIFFVVYIVLALIVTIFTNIYILNNKSPSYLLAVSVLVAVLILLFYLTFKRDETVD